MADELGGLCDVIEVFNARLHSEEPQQQARRLCERLGKLAGAGSDSHTLPEVGSTWVEVEGHANEPDALRAALEAGRVSGKSSSHLVHLGSTWAKVRKLVPGPWERKADHPASDGGGGRNSLAPWERGANNRSPRRTPPERPHKNTGQDETLHRVDSQPDGAWPSPPTTSLT